MVLSKDFREFIELLNASEVQYLVIGGYAVNFHGYPRYTKDIDFWILMEERNIQKLLSAIHEFGFGSLGLNVQDFSIAENIVQLGYEPNRIDLLVDVEGSNFTECFDRKKIMDSEGVKVNFISIQDLIEVKQNAGRLQDLADAEQLQKIKVKEEKKN